MFFSVLRNAAVLEKRYGFCEEEERQSARVRAEEDKRQSVRTSSCPFFSVTSISTFFLLGMLLDYFTSDPILVEELSLLLALAWPTGIASLARQLVSVADVAILGRLGTQYLAGASIAQIWIVSTQGFIWQALGSALNTLAAQADGAGEPALVGLWFQTALAVMALLLIPVTILWAVCTRPALLLLGFQDESATLAAEFCRFFILYLWASQTYVLVSNYLNSFSISWPPLFANVIMLGINVLANVLLVFGTQPFGSTLWSGIGFPGSPIASGITQVGVCFLMVLFIRSSPALYEKRWPGWKLSEAFAWERMRVFLGQAIPSFISFFLQDGFMQVMSFLAASMGDAQVAAHNSFLQFLFALTCLIYGLTKATQVRVASLLGKGDVKRAKLVAFFATAACSLVSLTVGMTVLASRNVLGYVFSKDPAVVAAASEIALPCGISFTLISLFYCSRAILAAQARPGPITVAFLVGAWGCGVPSGIAIAKLTTLGIAGIWYAMIIGLGTTTLIATIAVVRSDWEAISDKASIRAHRAALDEQHNLSEDGDHLVKENKVEEDTNTLNHAFLPEVEAQDKEGRVPLLLSVNTTS